MNVNSVEYMEKLANQLIEGDMMNPPPMPELDEGDVEGAQLANALAQEQQGLTAEGEDNLHPDALYQHQSIHGAPQAVIESAAEEVTEQVKQQIMADAVQEEMAEQEGYEDAMYEEQLAYLVAEELEKHASTLFELGTVAKLIECATGVQGEELQKVANEVLAYAHTDADSYYDSVEKVAEELFQTVEARNELFSLDGLLYVEEQLACLEDDGLLEKLANEGGNALNTFKNSVGDALISAKEKVVDAVKAMTDLKDISAQIEMTKADLAANTVEIRQNAVPTDFQLQQGIRNHEITNHYEELLNRQTLGRRALGATAGLAVGGAALGAHQLYNHFSNNQGENDPELLQHEKASGTLNKEYEKNGGNGNMSQKLVQDYLKIAGVAGLVSITNDESLDYGLRKEASDTLDAISQYSQRDLTDALVKVATQIYTPQELHEIVSHQHTGALLDKVAYFLYANESSISELEKTASAEGVAAAKNVGAGLADAAENIVATIDQEKEMAQGQGREYIGDLDNTGLAGGGLVGGTEGYGVINNPESYGVEQTAAAHLEEAFLTKQAAARAYVEADNFIRSVLG